MGYRPGPKKKLYLKLEKKSCDHNKSYCQKELNLVSKVIAIVFWNALIDAISCDLSKK